MLVRLLAILCYSIDFNVLSLGINVLTAYVKDRPEVVSDEFLIKVVPCAFHFELPVSPILI